ncbi:uncharacterized protein [Palaemon carinicauda]|uniref:uncharacterized protein n=1 Tax=Palaemon carinicauda TaxID=392227 RepID=UPI0035B648A6
MGQNLGVLNPEDGIKSKDPFDASKTVLINDNETKGVPPPSLPEKDKTRINEKGLDTPGENLETLEENSDNENKSPGSMEKDPITKIEGDQKNPKNHTEENLSPKEKNEGDQKNPKNHTEENLSPKEEQSTPEKNCEDFADCKETKDKPSIPKEGPKKPALVKVSDEKGSDETVNKASLPEDMSKSPSEKKDESGTTDVVAPSQSECDACLGWPVIVEAVGQALEDIQVDVDKQATRLGRMISTHNSQCNNCLKYQLFLAVAMYRLNDLYKYNYTLGQRIDSLLYRCEVSYS